MDEKELRDLFRDAPGQPPPPTFGPADVAAAAKRTTARQRMRLASAAAVVLLGLGGTAVLLGAFPFVERAEETAAAPFAASDDDVSEDGAGEHDVGKQPAAPAARPQSGAPYRVEEYSSKQGDDAPPDAVEDADTFGCAVVDRQLAIALAGELPVAPSREAGPMPGIGPCGDEVASAAYAVRDGDAAGIVSAAVVPDGVVVREPQARAATATARSADGGATVYVVSMSDRESGSNPYATQLQRIADALAATR